MDLGLVAFTSDLDTNLLASLVGVTNAGVNLFPLTVIETNSPSHARVWFNAAGAAVMTNGIAYEIDAWIATNYGAIPSYYAEDPTNAAIWTAERTPERIFVALSLIATSDVPAYFSNVISSAASAPDTNGVMIPLLELYSSNIAFVGHSPAAPVLLHLHAPTNVSSLGVFATTDLVARAWQQLTTLPHSSDPILYSYGGPLDMNIFALGDMADTDGDGIPDAVEDLITHTSTTNADSDADGLSDGSEFRQYASNPALFSTSTNGLRDGWMAENNMNPSAWVDPNTVAANGLTYAQLSAMGLPTNAPVEDLVASQVAWDYRSVSAFTTKQGTRGFAEATNYYLQNTIVWSDSEITYITNANNEVVRGSSYDTSGSLTGYYEFTNCSHWSEGTAYQGFTVYSGDTNEYSDGNGMRDIWDRTNHIMRTVHVFGGPSGTTEVEIMATTGSVADMDLHIEVSNNVVMSETNMVSWYARSEQGVTVHGTNYITTLQRHYTTEDLLATNIAMLDGLKTWANLPWGTAREGGDCSALTSNAAKTAAERRLSAPETNLLRTAIQYRIKLAASSNGVAYRATVAHIYTPTNANATGIVLNVYTYVTNGTGGPINLTPTNGVTIDPPTNNGTVAAVVRNVKRIYLTYGDSANAYPVPESAFTNYWNSLGPAATQTGDEWKYDDIRSNLLVVVKFVDEGGFRMALETPGAYAAFKGHANFGIGLAWSANCQAIADFMNVGTPTAGIDWPYMLAHQQPNLVIGDAWIADAPANYVTVLNTERFKNYAGVFEGQNVPAVGYAPPNNVFWNVYGTGTNRFHYFGMESNTDQRVIVKVRYSGCDDLPVLRYKWLLLDTCFSGQYYANSFQHSTLFYSRSWTGLRTDSFKRYVQCVVEGVPSGDVVTRLNGTIGYPQLDWQLDYQFKSF